MTRGSLSSHLWSHSTVYFGPRIGEWDQPDRNRRAHWLASLGEDTTQAQSLANVLQECIDECTLNTELSIARLRLLQDVCVSSLQFPEIYKLSQVNKGRRFAAGGEATVYEGTRPNGLAVMVREFHPPFGEWDTPAGQRITKLVLRESVSHWQLRHPNIAEFLGLYQPSPPEAPAMIIRRAKYHRASTYLEVNPDERSFMSMLHGIASGLRYLHSRAPPVIYGDLHTNNLVVDEGGIVQLCDFGLSRIRHEVSRTLTTPLGGGPHQFLAPEVDLGGDFHVIEAGDIYSFAAVTYDLATPHLEQSSKWLTKRRVMNGERPARPAKLGCLGKPLADSVWVLITGMWTHNPSNRPSINHVENNLTILYESIRENGAPPDYGKQTRSPSPTLTSWSEGSTTDTRGSPASVPTLTLEAIIISPLLDHLAEHHRQALQANSRETSKQTQKMLFATLLQNCIDTCPLDGKLAGTRLKALQDTCTEPSLCPRSYWITGVEQGRRIAAGGEATAYEGQYRGTAVVVRQFHPPRGEDWDSHAGHSVASSIVREVITHRQLRHENVVPFIGLWVYHKQEPPAMVLLRARFSFVAKYMQKHTEPGIFINIVRGIGDGLAYLHSRSPPLIHGDLHPDNLVVQEDGTVQICDFGLSRNRHEITRTQTNIRAGGHLRYLAPELTHGHEKFRTTEAGDVYSFSMVIYALSMQTHPFDKVPNEWAAAEAARHGKRPGKPTPLRLGSLAKQASKELWGLITRMWTAKEKKRPTADIVRGILHQITDGVLLRCQSNV